MLFGTFRFILLTRSVCCAKSMSNGVVYGTKDLFCNYPQQKFHHKKGWTIPGRPVREMKTIGTHSEQKFAKSAKSDYEILFLNLIPIKEFIENK